MMRNRKGDRIHPCRTPVSMSNIISKKKLVGIFLLQVPVYCTFCSTFNNICSGIVEKLDVYYYTE